MCGIAGILNTDSAQPIDIGELRPLADALRHRGPDADGYYVDPRQRCGLAFRRLAIIDLATGDQPIRNEDGSVWLVFNGEIYNYRELREELIRDGHVFRTQADGEVIVHGYEQWGDRCFARFLGMFAIALWSEPAGTLTLARDRFGKKPLHVAAARDGRLVFASELKAILASSCCERILNRAALHNYLLLQYVPDGNIFEGVSQVPPGHAVTYRAAGGALATVSRYYAVPRATLFAGSYADALQRLDELLNGAVKRRLISDVPLGAFLSGGIDSSIVVGLMRRLGVHPLRTFSIGFDDARYNEAHHARRVAECFRTEHYEQIVSPDSKTVLDALTDSYDLPFADSSAIPTCLLSRFARQAVTVALTGDAGDECFGGYDRYAAAQIAGTLDGLPSAARRLLSALAPLIPHGRAKSRSNRLYRFLHALGRRPSRRYADWVTVFPPEMLWEGYRPESRETLQRDGYLEVLDELYERAGRDAAHRAAYVDLHSYLPGDLLTKVDIASMASGLECRSPFLDHELVEFALSLPTAWKIRRMEGKRILRDWARGLLPPEILKRRKMGFGVPIGEWFRGPLRAELRERLLAEDGICRRLFERTWLEQLYERHLAQQANHEHRLWSLFVLDRWARRWKPVV